jgi:hypothetical protein
MPRAADGGALDHFLHVVGAASAPDLKHSIVYNVFAFLQKGFVSSHACARVTCHRIHR